MNGSRMAMVLWTVALAVPALAQAQASPYDEIRGEVAALAERVGRLEAENRTLRQRNDDLERRMAALQAPAGEPPVVAAASVAVPGTAPGAGPEPDLAVLESTPARPATPWYERLEVSGYLFGDAYAVLEHHDPAIDDQTGFWIRRGYLTFDADVADEWSARLRFEVNSPGDFTTNAKMNPFVKDAYLAWKRSGQELHLGLSSSPTFEFVEAFWGQRALEKTPLDLYRMGSSRDLGVAYRGSAQDGRVFYHAMLGNGSGDGSETNQGKKIMAGLGFRPTNALAAQVYADYEDRPGSTDRSTLQAFVGWAGPRSRFGLQYAVQQREVESGPDDEAAVASAFGVWRLMEEGTLIVRYDRSFDGYPDANRIPYLAIADDMRFDLAILAWEQRLQKKISLIPNLEYVRYRDTEGRQAPGDDLHGRLTLYYQF
jgi:hypothetical protein